MILIVDGADGAGKSTLAQGLSEYLKCKIYKESVSYKDRQKKDYDGKEHYLKETYGMMNSLTPGSDIIIDRFFIGEFVCPTVYRDEDKRNPLTLRQVSFFAELLSKKHNVGFITCIPSREFAEEAYVTRGEDVATISDLVYLNNLYSAAGYHLEKEGYSSFVYRPDEWVDDTKGAVIAIASKFGILTQKTSFS